MKLTNSALVTALATTLLTMGCDQSDAPSPNVKVHCEKSGCTQHFAKMEPAKVNDLPSSKPEETRIMKWTAVHFNYNDLDDQTIVDQDFIRAGWIRADADLLASASPKMICGITFTQRGNDTSNTTACWSKYGSITPGSSTLDRPRVIDYVTVFEALHDLISEQVTDKK